MTVSKSSVYFFLSIILYKISTDYVYITFTSPLFSYAGMTADFSLLKYFEGFLVFILLAILAKPVIEKPSDFFMLFTLVIYYIPIITFYTFTDNPAAYFYMIVATWLIPSLLLKLPNFNVLTFKFQKETLTWFVPIFVIFLTFFIFVLVSPSNINFDLTREYEFRPVVSERLSGYGLPYLTAWMPSFIGPLVMAYALHSKRYFLFLFFLLIHISWFGLTSHKTLLFVPFLILGIWVYFKNNKSSWYIPFIFSVIILLTVLVYFLYEFGLPASLMARRFLMVPAKVTFDYYHFFDGNHLYWSNSILSEILDYPLSDHYAKIIGLYNGTGDYANVGFAATGYMHGGIFGIVIYLFLYTIFLKIIDSITGKIIPLWFSICCFAMSINIMTTSGDLLTTMFTHGLIPAIILVFFSRTIFLKRKAFK